MSQRKISPALRAELQRMGLEARAYQPVWLFKKEPSRRLANVARDDDPWHVTVSRTDRVIWADGSTVATATGPTLDEAVKAALPAGLFGAILKLGVAADQLAEAMRGCR